MRYALLIPCFEPDERVVNLIKEIEEFNSPAPDGIFIVNDGSGSEYDHVFLKLDELGCTIISYKENKGKGAALRTGIQRIVNSGEAYSYIITADADGQHKASDIIKIAKEAAVRDDASLILGVRSLSGKNVPTRSRFGNGFSSLYFRFVTGIELNDTQTGLRAIPARLYDLALKTPGERYDYEMNFLIAAVSSRRKKDSGIRTVPIRTLYSDGNSGSHFRTFRDSALIYKTPLRYIAVSLICAAADLSLFTVMSAALGTYFRSIFMATAVSRIVSGILNFTLNRKWSFSSIRSEDGRPAVQAVRYLILFVLQMIMSSVMVTLLSFLPVPLTLVKILVDTGLSLFSYYMQHNWVFSSRKSVDNAAFDRLKEDCENTLKKHAGSVD